ncbi:IS110 family transposase [Candidatus Micrarchaeota archaeon]|nr:IS110 family transposase [Candidatus Micrarchaeota archaeon]
MEYVGLDMHKKFTFGTVMDSKGKIRKQEKFLTDRDSIKKFLEGVKHAKIAIESSTSAIPWHGFLTDMGHDVHVSHPLKTKLIAESKIKTDKVDSQVLADLLRSNFLPCSYVPGAEIVKLRNKTRHRVYLGRLKTSLKNRIRSELGKRGIDEPDTSLFTRKGNDFLVSLNIGEINSSLEVLEFVETKIKRSSEELEQVAKQHEDVKLLKTIPGVGTYSALLIFSEIADIGRFGNAEKLCCYAGVVPSIHQSGSVLRSGRTTKQGSAWLRWILTEVVWVHINNSPGSNLTKFFKKLAKTKGKKKAAVATSRKLLHVIYAMLRDRKPFMIKGQEKSRSAPAAAMTA